MLNFEHKSLAEGRFREFSLVEQLANVGSEVLRALNWRKKERPEYAQKAFYRSLELLYFTIDDPKNLGRLKELTRLKEVWIDFFAYDNVYSSTAESFEKYFLAFNYAANNH